MIFDEQKYKVPNEYTFVILGLLSNIKPIYNNCQTN